MWRRGKRGPWGPRREVRHMEITFVDPQYLPVTGSLVAAGLLLATVIGAVVYGWLREKPSHAAAEQEPLQKAA